MPRRMGLRSLTLGTALLAAAGWAFAQNPSATTTTQMGAPETKTTTTNVSGTIVSVNGNKVIVKDAAGASKEYTVPEGFKFQMGGKDVGVADLKPGMSVSASITTSVTTTPVTVTEIRKGKVLAVSGETVIVRGPQGVRSFTQEEINRRHIMVKNDKGEDVALGSLRPGDRFTAVIVTNEPPKVVSERQAKAMVQPAPEAHEAAAAPAPAAAPAAAAAPAPAPAEKPAKKLPKTASQVPLAGTAGAFSLVAALALGFARRARTSR